MEPIKFVIGLVGILTFLFMIKGKVDDALAVIRAPAHLNFYFLFFWAVTAALFGGLLWAGFQRLLPNGPRTDTFEPTLGGSQEPHGLAAILWPVITNLPTAALILVLSYRYGVLSATTATVASGLLLGGLVVASVVFYDIPLRGVRGIRLYVEAKHLGYAPTEMLLVTVWSTLLTLVPLLLMYLANKLGWISGPGASLASTGIAIGVSVGLTVFVVGFFVAAYPVQKYEAARCVLAALALRVSLFFALFLSSKA